ncbi:MAG: calcium-binding EGF-like domain-containing protein [Chitinophagaceae bacterium]|nr:calcium-binding EGF-like domain-containing protein [Chitinophagaceae bacterium]
MKNLKSILVASFLTVGIFSTTVFTSCDPDPCQDVICNNGGTCTDGTCTCKAGYEGTDCSTLSRTKFIGTYTGNETCTVGTDSYSIQCTTNSDDTKFNIINLYNNSPQLTAIASADGNSFTIPSQTVGAGVTASGSGAITSNSITITYTISDGVSTNTCTYTGTK